MSHYGVARDLRAGLIQRGTSLELITPSVTKFHVDNRSIKMDIEVQNKKTRTSLYRCNYQQCTRW